MKKHIMGILLFLSSAFALSCIYASNAELLLLRGGELELCGTDPSDTKDGFCKKQNKDGNADCSNFTAHKGNTKVTCSDFSNMEAAPSTKDRQAITITSPTSCDCLKYKCIRVGTNGNIAKWDNGNRLNFFSVTKYKQGDGDKDCPKKKE